jgi:hypothetical protein
VAPKPKTVRIALGSESDRDLRLDQIAWERVEAALEKQVCLTTRGKITDATNRFLWFAPFERLAEPVSGVKRRLKTITKAADHLYQTLILDDKSVAELYAEQLIATRLNTSVWDIAEAILRVANSSKAAIAELEIKPSGFQRGQRWGLWVQELSKILEDEGLPITVRKDVDKHSGKPSAFVRFIVEMHEYIPIEDRWGTHSLVALAVAITRARKSGPMSRRKAKQ